MDADLKTLRLSNPPLTPESLERCVRYQRALVGYFGQHPEPTTGGWEGRMAFAHAAALQQSGASPDEVTRLSPVLADFCGRQSTLRTLRFRRQELEQHPDRASREKLARLQAELTRLEGDGTFEARYGAAARALLEGRGDELVDLHRQVASVLGGGHLHRA